LYKGVLTTVPRLEAAGSKGGPGSDIYTWFKFSDRSIIKNGDAVPLQRGLDEKGGLLGAPYWDCEWSEPPGRYFIGCRIQSRARNTTTWCFYSQRIAEVDSVLSPMLAEVKENGPVHPDEAISHWAQYVETVQDAASLFPPVTPADVKRREVELKPLLAHLDGLKKKLGPYKDRKFHRFPVSAMHISVVDQQTRQLNVFVVKVESKPAYEEVVSVGERGGWRRVKHPPQERWMLIDWTIPTRPDICQEAEGLGETDKDAIENAFAAWNFSGNRYETGRVQYSLKIKDLETSGAFDTNGRTAWDTLVLGLNYVSQGAMIVVGVAALLVPVPGAQIVSSFMWAAIMSSTASSAISMAQRIDEGSGTWKENAIDGLTIIANVFAGVGTVARTTAAARATATRGAWAGGASMIFKQELPAIAIEGRTAGQALRQTDKTARWMLIGQVAADATQGILVLDQHLEEYNSIMSDRSMSPRARVDRLLNWISRVVGDAGLMYVSFRGSKAELDAGKKRNKYLKGDGQAAKTGAELSDRKLDDVSKTIEVRPVEEKLDKAGTKKQHIEIDSNVPAEGHTNPDKKDGHNLQTKHKTVAHTSMQHDQHVVGKKKRRISKEYFESRPPDIWRVPPKVGDYSITLIRKFPGYEGSMAHDVKFVAHFTGDTIKVDIVETHRSVGDAPDALSRKDDPKAGLIVKGDRLFVEEVNAAELYPFMFERFEKTAAQTGRQVEYIAGEFAYHNFREVEAALKKDPSLFIDKTNGHIHPDALKASKTWHYWEEYAHKHGYELVPDGLIEFSPFDQMIKWRFRIVRP
jgi:hypothetical protein